MPDGLDRLAALVEESAGSRLGSPGRATLRAALARLAPGTTPDDAVGELGDGPRPALIDALAREVLVHETFFLRHPDELERIDWLALHAEARRAGSGPLRAWSAGCSTGEEAYSLAIAAAEALGTCAPPVAVLGTDLSPAVLARARAGTYGPRTLRHVSAEQRSRWFVPADDGLRVGDALGAAVTFAEHNLVRDPMPEAPEPAFDVVVCRNVLIYFAPATAQRVVANLERALRPGGTLVLGAADRLVLRRAQPPVGAGPAGAARTAAARRTAPALAGAAGAPVAGPSRVAAPSAGPSRVDPRARTSRVAAPPAASRSGAQPADGPADTPAAVAVEALESGLEALRRRDLPGAVAAFRRARYLDADLVEAGLHLGRAHEAAGDVRAARSAYQGVLHQITGGRPELLRGRAATTDVAAACEARLHDLPET